VLYPNMNSYFSNSIILARFKENIDLAVKKRYPWLEIPES
jgi:hypothetical protein